MRYYEKEYTCIDMFREEYELWGKPGQVREKPDRVLSFEASLIRLMGSVLMEEHD